MRKTRVFIQTSLSIDQQVNVEADTAHYLINVLRVRQGQILYVFNGQGGCFEAEVDKVAKKTVLISLHSFIEDNRQSPLDLTLIQGISRGQHMDYTVQKAVELGVTAIVPVFTEYGNVKLSDERAHKRLEHWQKIIISASEQSGSNILPVLHEPVALLDWVMTDTNALRLVLHPDSNTRLSAIETDSPHISFVCGPEGGLSDQEIDFCQKSGYQKVSLGPRILRTETAALAAIAICQSRFGDV